MTSKITAAYELVKVCLVEFVDVSLHIVLVGLLLVVCQHIDMGGECIHILIGTVSLHLLKFLGCLRRTDLAIYHSPFLVAIRVLRVEIDSLVVEACSFTTVGTISGFDIT